jgi:sulfopropanediol 3-dehydrogenase
VAKHLKHAKDMAAVRREVVDTVSEMLLRIEREREDAVRAYSEQLDGWAPESFTVGPDEIERAAAEVPPELADHIDAALGNVRTFAAAQRETMTDLDVETAPGVVLGHRHVPVDRVGAYVPGGAYQMFVSSFMTVGVAKAAGVREVVTATPPYQGAAMSPLMLHAVVRAGADVVLCLGGVQAMATLAHGLFGLEPADMITGAGNAYVAEAKRQLYGLVGIDLLAGPTEILVIADESADARLVAIDLLGQAEHGPTSPAVLVTTSERVGRGVLDAVDDLLAGDWPTAEITARSWGDYGQVIVVEDDEEAVAVADSLAPEHLELQIDDGRLDHYHERLRNYGSLFAGHDATVAYGDKGIGTNHVLPTGGAARYTGGLWVGRFLKTLTYQRVTPEGTAAIAPMVSAIATAEGMLGHAFTADERLRRLESGAHTRR